jgi:hypothetical protein
MREPLGFEGLRVLSDVNFVLPGWHILVLLGILGNEFEV